MKDIKMNKILLILESPNKAKKVQEYLGDDYIVMSSFGHIKDLSNKNNLGIDVNNNFKLYYSILPDKIRVVDELINAAEKCKSIYLFSDLDREGEKISHNLMEVLESTGKPIKRIISTEITKEGVEEALNNPRDIDINLVRSQEARRALDRIVGYKVSPFLINFFGDHLSSGRVQSVCVEMISDREKEIKDFEPKEYWNLFLNINKNNIIQAKYDGRILSKDQLDKIISEISGTSFYVNSVSEKDKKDKPNPPLITSKMQQIMSTKFGFSADRTMKAAQTLYEYGYCTYIRTDSTQISDKALKSVRKWIKDQGYQLPKSANVYKDKNAQAAHECIRPTNINTTSSEIALDKDEKILYDVIWKYFVASQMESAVWAITDVSIKNEKNHSFKLSAKVLKQKGYLEILDYESDKENHIPPFTKDEILIIDDKKPLEYEQKFTQPPPRYTDASLIKELDKKQIGRPATYADILKKILDRGYVEKKGNSYYLTDLGNKITNILKDNFSFMDYDFTANMEKSLDEIADGKQTYLDVLKSFYSTFSKNLNNAYQKYGAEKCEKCGSFMVKRKTREGKFFMSCGEYPKCKFSKSVNDNANDKNN